MGNGQMQMSKPISAALMKQLREEYDKYSGLGYGDGIIQEKLEQSYEAFMEQALADAAAAAAVPAAAEPTTEGSSDAQAAAGATAAAVAAPESAVAAKANAAPTKVAPAAAPLATKSAAATGASRKAGGGKKSSTRRRSFEPSPAVAAPKPPATRSIVTSASDNVLPTASVGATVADVADAADGATSDEAAAAADASVAALGAVPAAPEDASMRDNWDSVSQMPYCDVCKTGFKTAGLLDRHVKYSELHSKNEALRAAAAAAAAEGDAAGIAAGRTVEVRKAVEGEDYLVMYTGSKFFWRSQDNIDLRIFHHLVADTLEVVPFDASKNRQLPRLYMSHPLAVVMIEADLLAARAGATAASSRSKFTAPTVDEQALVRKTLTTAILARLQLKVDDHSTGKGKRVIVYVPNSGDGAYANPLLKTVPAGIVPVSVTHRRNTSSQEVQQKLEALQVSQAELAAATSKAEKVLNHVQSFAKNMKAEFLAMSKMSVPRKRWVVAINRVLQINGVKKTTAFLEKLAALENATATAQAPVNGSPGRRDRNAARSLTGSVTKSAHPSAAVNK